MSKFYLQNIFLLNNFFINIYLGCLLYLLDDEHHPMYFLLFLTGLIVHQWSYLLLVQVMAFHLTTPSHYLDLWCRLWSHGKYPSSMEVISINICHETHLELLPGKMSKGNLMQTLNSLRLSNAYKRQYNIPTLVQIMAFSLFRHQAIIWTNDAILSIRP